MSIKIGLGGQIILDREMPGPPEKLIESFEEMFVPATELSEWAREMFILENGPLVNEEHEHLREADIGILWTNVGYVKKRKQILGEARLGEPSKSNAWTHGRQVQQLRDWFGGVPDFVITLDARFVHQASDAEICALVEHELMHCSQRLDEFGMPSFSRVTGKPLWRMRAHDVEEFVGVVRRYGMDATRTRMLVEAANQEPLIGHTELAGACGSCLV